MKVVNSSGEYAFLMESNSIQYQIERNCDLIQVPRNWACNDKTFPLIRTDFGIWCRQVGKLLDSKGYGIAFTPGSLYRVPISSAILQLQVKLLLF